MMRRLFLVLIVPLIFVLGSTGVVQAHALLIGATPTPDSILQSEPSIIHLRFSEDLNVAASRIIVWDRYRHPMQIGDAFGVPGRPRELEVRVRTLKPGSYLVLWTSVSADDGHLLRGSFLFSYIKQGPGPSVAGLGSGNAQSFPDLSTGLAIVAHWLELLLAVFWAGAAAFSAIVLRGTEAAGDEERRRLRRVLLVTLVLLDLASTGVLLKEAYDLAGNLSGIFSARTVQELFAAEYGTLWVARQIIILISIVLLFMAGTEMAGALTVMGFVYLWAFAASGHGASAAIGAVPGHNGQLFSISIFADWLHFIADALWFGGQIYLVLVLIPTVRAHGFKLFSGFMQALDRFSPAAFLSIALYSTSGLFAAKVHIPSWYAFFWSPYGRALIIKMVLIGLMMLVSTYTVFLVRPRLKKHPGSALFTHLLRWLHVNPVLGAGVLFATSVMFYYPVPPGFAPPGPSSYTVQGAGMKARVSISPDHSGPNRITVRLTTAAGKPITQARIVVLTDMLDMIMGKGLAVLNPTGPAGTFSGTTDLGMGGRWRLDLLVYTPKGLSRLPVVVSVGV